MAFNRRQFIHTAGVALGASVLGFPAIARAQGEPIRLGLMTVKTGPLASGGLDMERDDGPDEERPIGSFWAPGHPRYSSHVSEPSPWR